MQDFYENFVNFFYIRNCTFIRKVHNFFYFFSASQLRKFTSKNYLMFLPLRLVAYWSSFLQVSEISRTWVLYISTFHFTMWKSENGILPINEMEILARVYWIEKLGCWSGQWGCYEDMGVFSDTKYSFGTSTVMRLCPLPTQTVNEVCCTFFRSVSNSVNIRN